MAKYHKIQQKKIAELMVKYHKIQQIKNVPLTAGNLKVFN